MRHLSTAGGGTGACGHRAVRSVRQVEITFVKGHQADVGDRGRVYLEADGELRRAAVHAGHDLPHLVVESLFGIGDGLWAELAAGSHAEANLAATARDSKRQKHGRIVSGAASGAGTPEWLSEGHRMAKTVTNAVVNRWGDGPDTPSGVRARLAREDNEPIRAVMARVDDATITAAISGVLTLAQRWAATPPGATLRLSWPLERSNLS